MEQTHYHFSDCHLKKIVSIIISINFNTILHLLLILDKKKINYLIQFLRLKL